MEAWLEGDLPARFQGRLLPVDARVARRMGIAERENQGIPLGAMDALIAATARVLDLTVVSRNESDLKPSVPVLNPWSGDSDRL
ncbi:MAG: PIN domain-containing protein [Candidatus Eremiobacterota bacterium]